LLSTTGAFVKAERDHITQNDQAHGAINSIDDHAGSTPALMPIMAGVFIAYLVIGVAMPVIPL